MAAQYSQWSVVAHRSGRFLTVGSHRNYGAVDVFLAEAEHKFLACQVVDRVVNLTSGVQFFKLYTVGRKPLTVRMGACESLLDFSVVVDFALLSVDKENLAWLQASFFGNLSWVKVHDTHFGCHDHGVILGNSISCRAQTVAVEHSSGVSSVAEQQCGRAVPRFHKYRVILVESLQIFGYRVLVVEALRHHHSHGVRQ